MREIATKRMPCPCCGGGITLGVDACPCGARFVGNPVDEAPVRVRGFGPAMTSVGLLILVTAAALIFTKWLALAGVAVAWSARRAMRLARQDSEAYGGYRAAAATLIVTLAAGAVAAGFGIAYVPRYLRNRQAMADASNNAVIYHVASMIEEYKQKYGSYPNAAAYNRLIAEQVATDYWNNAIRYEGYTESIAVGGRRSGPTLREVHINNFELRSPGADGELDTADDIVMRDGLFVTPDAKASPVGQGASGR